MCMQQRLTNKESQLVKEMKETESQCVESHLHALLAYSDERRGELVLGKEISGIVNTREVA
jgi:hypothetical protein